jgi:hypothetical protein
VCVCVVGSMWLCRDEQEVTVISHNNLLFVLCTKYHDMGAEMGAVVTSVGEIHF